MILAFSVIILAHLYGDFFQQRNWMAMNKSKWNESYEGRHALFSHVYVYALCLLVFLVPLCAGLGLSWSGGLGYLACNTLAHLLTDAFTSKMTSKYWFIAESPHHGWMARQNWIKKNEWLTVPDMDKRHWFFVWLGIDQSIHMLTLLWTLPLLGV